MKTVTTTLFLVILALSATSAESQAGWKKRGWYAKKPQANCVMRKVVVPTENGRVVSRVIRVCF